MKRKLFISLTFAALIVALTYHNICLWWWCETVEQVMTTGGSDGEIEAVTTSRGYTMGWHEELTAREFYTAPMRAYTSK